MLTKQVLLDLFLDKLAKSKSLDEAFLKAVWVAYNRGLADGRAARNAEPEKVDDV